MFSLKDDFNGNFNIVIDIMYMRDKSAFYLVDETIYF